MKVLGNGKLMLGPKVGAAPRMNEGVRDLEVGLPERSCGNQEGRAERSLASHGKYLFKRLGPSCELFSHNQLSTLV